MLSDFVLERLSRLAARRSDKRDPAHHDADTAGGGDPTRPLPGRQRETSSGPYWHIDGLLEQILPEPSHGMRRFPRDKSHPAEVDDDHPELAALRNAAPTDVAFLDLETCGFSGSPIFLIGLVRAEGEAWVVRQLLARTYAEEEAILESLWGELQSVRVLVTFNGKSFDWPVIKDRTIRYRPRDHLAWDFVHCDLLHHARRCWKAHLPDCRLQTLETYVCGRFRRGDIPGQDIPRVYDQFVRSGDVTAIRTILHHNTLDLVTLVQLARMFGVDWSQRNAAFAEQ